MDDNLKFGKQELLLDPAKVANKCGSEVDPLLANDLMVKKEDGTFIPLIDYITQIHISIENLEVTANNNDVVISWQGTDDVLVSIDGNAGNPPNGDRQHTVQLVAGVHTIHVQANRDLRGLTKSITVSNPPVPGEEIIVEYN